MIELRNLWMVGDDVCYEICCELWWKLWCVLLMVGFGCECGRGKDDSWIEMCVIEKAEPGG